MLFKKLILVFVLLFIFSCSQERSIDSKYLLIYKDILIVGSSTTDSLVAAIKRDSVFKSYGITEADFRKWTIEESKNRDVYLKALDSLRNSIIIYQKKLKLKDTIN